MRAPKFSQFHAVLGKIWQNRILPPPEGWRPDLGEILDPPLFTTENVAFAHKCDICHDF